MSALQRMDVSTSVQASGPSFPREQTAELVARRTPLQKAFCTDSLLQIPSGKFPTQGKHPGQASEKRHCFQSIKKTLYPFTFKIPVSMTTRQREENGRPSPLHCSTSQFLQQLNIRGPARFSGCFLLSPSPFIAGPPQCQPGFVFGWRRL